MEGEHGIAGTVVENFRNGKYVVVAEAVEKLKMEFEFWMAHWMLWWLR